MNFLIKNDVFEIICNFIGLGNWLLIIFYLSWNNWRVGFKEKNIFEGKVYIFLNLVFYIYEWIDV